MAIHRCIGRASTATDELSTTSSPNDVTSPSPTSQVPSLFRENFWIFEFDGYSCAYLNFVSEQSTALHWAVVSGGKSLVGNLNAFYSFNLTLPAISLSFITLSLFKFFTHKQFLPNFRSAACWITAQTCFEWTSVATAACIWVHSTHRTSWLHSFWARGYQLTS